MSDAVIHTAVLRQTSAARGIHGKSHPTGTTLTGTATNKTRYKIRLDALYFRPNVHKTPVISMYVQP